MKWQATGVCISATSGCARIRPEIRVMTPNQILLIDEGYKVFKYGFEMHCECYFSQLKVRLSQYCFYRLNVYHTGNLLEWFFNMSNIQEQKQRSISKNGFLKTFFQTRKHF